MSEAKKPAHTPEPWAVELMGPDKVMCVTTPKQSICEVLQDSDSYEEQVANGHLIAAAPTLLAACLAVVREYEAGAGGLQSTFRRLAMLCVAAVAKATTHGV